MNVENYRKKLIGNEEERAVSPVIGVILMVAITVILAAVIAAFVLDLGSGLENQAQAGVSISDDETAEVTVTVESLANADKVEIRNSAGNEIGTNPGDGTINSVGGSLTVDSNGNGDVNAGAGDYSVVALYENGEGANTVATFTVT
ncbi:type IV pilin N-terminal domain-containing protein [Halosolutus halophilus]|uniref:type IV pilin N-terminal domain-containing protein n=1 Tax=Halosolutus halophilus TaxID=1552990 RepID=UPI0022351419|nr:type IV pilin N-terminal domain-containing protein [Halosolutus halophilus]